MGTKGGRNKGEVPIHKHTQTKIVTIHDAISTSSPPPLCAAAEGAGFESSFMNASNSLSSSVAVFGFLGPRGGLG